MAFKKKREIHLSYEAQGLIYFLCLNNEILPRTVQKKFDTIIEDVGGVYSDALRTLLYDERVSVLSVSMEYYIGEKKLNALRRKFYERAYAYLTK